LQEFRELAAEILSDARRPGAPLKFSAEQVCQIIAVACEEPAEESARPISHWSRRELADEVNEQERDAQCPARCVRHSGTDHELRGQYPPQNGPSDCHAQRAPFLLGPFLSARGT